MYSVVCRSDVLSLTVGHNKVNLLESVPILIFEIFVPYCVLSVNAMETWKFILLKVLLSSIAQTSDASLLAFKANC